MRWRRHGGFAQREGIRAPRLISHLLIAVIGLALWIAYLVTDGDALAWIAVGGLVIVALLGISMLAISSRGRTALDRTATPAEAMFPVPIVIAHGALGTTTLVLAALAAAEVGS